METKETVSSDEARVSTMPNIWVEIGKFYKQIEILLNIQTFSVDAKTSVLRLIFLLQMTPEAYEAFVTCSFVVSSSYAYRRKRYSKK